MTTSPENYAKVLGLCPIGINNLKVGLFEQVCTRMNNNYTHNHNTMSYNYYTGLAGLFKGKGILDP